MTPEIARVAGVSLERVTGLGSGSFCTVVVQPGTASYVTEASG